MDEAFNGCGPYIAASIFFILLGIWKFIDIAIWLICHVKVVA